MDESTNPTGYPGYTRRQVVHAPSTGKATVQVKFTVQLKDSKLTSADFDYEVTNTYGDVGGAPTGTPVVTSASTAWWTTKYEVSQWIEFSGTEAIGRIYLRCLKGRAVKLQPALEVVVIGPEVELPVAAWRVSNQDGTIKTNWAPTRVAQTVQFATDKVWSPFANIRFTLASNADARLVDGGGPFGAWGAAGMTYNG
jgi:hypothetical protein